MAGVTQIQIAKTLAELEVLIQQESNSRVERAIASVASVATAQASRQ